MFRPVALFVALVFVSLARSAEESPAFRASAGLGMGNGWPGFSGRMLFGSQESALRLGLDGRYFEEFVLFKWPSEHVGAFHAVAAWELSRKSPVTVMFLGGLGMASHLRRGGFTEADDQEFFGSDKYESLASVDPSLMLGMDLGLSWARRVGLSGQLGVQVSEITMPFALLQIDIGAW